VLVRAQRVFSSLSLSERQTACHEEDSRWTK
jgi:hypothetical protein